MKILFIFTGGTIGSTKFGDVIQADTKKTKTLIDEYDCKYGIGFEYDVVEPYTELSENCTGEHLYRLLSCVHNGLSLNYDGIIVTHGTDTLAYSSSAIGYSVGQSSVPVCIVSGNYPIEDERSNAIENLHGAVLFISKKCGQGAFVFYRNGLNGVVCVHRATRLLASKAFSDDVNSAYDCEYGSFDKTFKFIKNACYAEKKDEMLPLKFDLIEKNNHGITCVSPIVGATYPSIDKDVKYILLGTYHSGTLNTKSKEATDFFEDARKKGIIVFATGIYNGAEYESATHFSKLGIIPVKNISPIAVYVKLWLLSSNGISAEQFIQKSLSGDVVPLK